ncbi:unnamed protein product [Lactuca virosa]|uniref:Replication factor A C-terminal domain-containing protein n=1 Tax=Lactuca virosa TaxID=75947 RepID=A0AAU9LNV1_9ASTR|nr:unnamed protein product [Lactuca virosa]
MTSISDLKTDGIGGPLQVRILRKWKHDVRQYETWYLAVDRFADAIQILGQRTNQSYIESVLHVSQCYTISDYSCPQLDNYQKFLQNEFYIDVGLKSIIQPIPDTLTIPKTWFRFVPKSHLIDLGERPPYYPDYIGVLSKIRDCTKAGGESFVLLILTDESGSELAINLWKECITNPDKFNCDSLHPPPATMVVVVTNLKPSIYNGVLRYGSSHATHIYVNPDIPETIALINPFTGPSRPAPPLSGTPLTLYDMKTKNRYDLLASIKEFHYQNNWFQPICPICKDPIFKRGESWYCSAHGLIEKPTYMYKLTVTITDATDTISALISETSCQKLLKSSLENFISNNPHIKRNTLPPIITNHKEQTKKMSIQMLRASTPDNIRFIITDIEDPTTRAQTSVPATPAQPQMTRMQPSDTIPEPSTPVQHVARALTYDPTESTPRKKCKADSQTADIIDKHRKMHLLFGPISLSFVI